MKRVGPGFVKRHPDLSLCTPEITTSLSFNKMSIVTFFTLLNSTFNADGPKVKP